VPFARFFWRSKRNEKTKSIFGFNSINSMDEVQNKTILPKQVVPKWYALYTHPRAEKQVFSRLEETGVETYLPLQKTYRQWSDRRKLIEKPLLSSYVFVKVIPKDFPLVYKTPGVVKFVSFEGQPVPIPQKQIDNLRLLIDSNAKIEVSSEKFEKGDNVEVITGSLRGLTGELIKAKGRKKVIVRIEELKQNIIVTIPVTFLRKI
jgi:transcriptional antiterminator RfaH